MIQFFFLVLWSIGAIGAEPSYWSHLINISEQHEFYQNNEPILKPKNSWQTLFAFSYIDQNFQQLKDCVFYKVPGSDPGVLKLKTISSVEKCETYLLKEGDVSLGEIKTLVFNLIDKKVIFDLTFEDFKSTKWEAVFQDTYNRPGPRMNLSSAEFKSPKLILLAPNKKIQITKLRSFLKESSICHEINEDCEEVKTSVCDQCANGWYEIPNGCLNGPKYCGIQNCGQKNGPACRRGIRWQKVEGPTDCRINSNFAYCAEGLDIYCEGKKAFCR